MPVIHHPIEIDIDLIKPDPENPNRMTEQQVAGLRESINKFGYFQYCVVDQNYMLIDGHNRFADLKAQGIKKIPVIQVTVSDTERRMMRQAANKLHGVHDLALDIAELEKIRDASPEDRELLAKMVGINDDVLKVMQANLEVGKVENDAVDMSPRSHHAETYLMGNIKQIVLYFNNAEYEKVVPLVDQVIQQENKDSSTPVFIKAFKEYYESHGYGTWPEGAPTGE